MGNAGQYQEEYERKNRIRNFFEYLWLCILGLFIALCIIGIIGVKYG